MMNTTEKWNYIVSRHSKLYNAQEKEIQSEWETYCSELFDYKKLFNEIDAFRSMQIGSHERVIPDIILKNSNKDLIDIELKQYNLPFDIKFEEQLKSYLKLLSLSVGIIVCQKIYLCWLNDGDKKIYKIAIPFTENNPDGIILIDLLCKETFSAEKIKDYIKNKLTTKINIQKIKNEITPDLIYKLLSSNFENEKYSDEEILQALDTINISVSEKNKSITPPPQGKTIIPPPKTVRPNEPDNTDFPNSPDFIIIKTHWERVTTCKHYFNCSNDDALYHATRHSWRVSYEKVIHYGYVLAVIDGNVKEVYKVKQWNQVRPEDVWGIDNNKAAWRFEFVGEVADDSIREKFINKTIPFKYRKPGMAAPVIFSK